MQLTANWRELRSIYDWRARYAPTPSSYVGHALRQFSLVREFLPQRNALCCDVACGTGAHLKALSILGFQNLVGCDVSGEAIKRARSLLPAVRFHWGQQEALQICADVILCFLPCFGRTRSEADLRYLSSLRRMSSPNATLFFSAFTLEQVGALPGRHRVRYHSSLPPIESDVIWSAPRKRIEIRQRVAGKRVSNRIESFRIYSHSELLALMGRSGWSVKATLSDPVNGAELFVLQSH